MKVYYCILPDGFDFFSQDELLDGLPENISSRLSDNNSIKRMLSLIGWHLLKNITSFNLLKTVDFEEKGKPFFQNSDLYFNISNTKNIITLAIGSERVGVDVEKLREPRKIIYQRVFAENEIQSIEDSNNKVSQFTQLWTRKESVVKLFGGGISMGLTTFSALEDCVQAFKNEVIIQKVLIPNYICHLSTYQKVNLEVKAIDPRDLI